MPIDPKTAQAVVAAAQLAFDVIVHFLDDDISHEEMLRTLKGLIVGARNDIVETMQRLRLEDLEGDVDGLLLTFASYDPIPVGGGEPSASEGERLREVIDTAAQVIGDLAVHVRKQPNITIVFGALPLLATMVALRAAAMIERTHTYRIDDNIDVAPMLRMARGLLPAVRRRSDRRFGPIEIRRSREPGTGEAGYRFERRFRVAALLRINSAGNPVRPLPAAVENRRLAHMTRAYEAIPGVVAIASFRITRRQSIMLRRLAKR